MATRRALMLISGDKDLVDIALRLGEQMAACEERIDQIRREAKAVQVMTEEARAKAHRDAAALIAKRGVFVFDRKNHELALDLESGVLWLEPKGEDCDCPVCTLRGLFTGAR